MRLTYLADYAVVMMTAAAARCGAGGCGRWSATELAAETGVPLPTAQKLMQLLGRAGLMSGQRGTGGGYALARPPAAISLADIIEAVEGPIGLAPCGEGADCARDAVCTIKPHLTAAGDAVRAALAAVSLAQLAQPLAPAAAPMLEEVA